MMPGQKAQVQDIIAGVGSGRLDIKDVDRNVRRVLEYIVKTPSFRDYPYTNKPDLKAHAAISRQAAAEGIVLLKNNGALPLSTEGALSPLTSHPSSLIKKVALFGENSYDFFSGGTGSGCVHPAYVVDMLEGLRNAGISSTEVLTDIYKKYIEYAKVKFQAERHPAKWFQKEYFGQQKYPEIALNRRVVGEEIKKADAAAVSDNEYNRFIKDRQQEGKPLPAGETLKKDAEALKEAEGKAKAEEQAPGSLLDNLAPEKN